MDIIEKYVTEHSVRENEALRWIRKQTNLRTTHPRMLSGPVQGGLLTILAGLSGVKRALELGTFTGYSSVCIALGLPPDGHLDSLEINDELVDVIYEGWERAGVRDKITLHSGNALDTLERFRKEGAEAYDMVYIDADKRHYCEFFEAVLPLVREGGLIIADNTLWGGKVLMEPRPTDGQTEGIFRFNEAAASDTRVRTVMIPVRDGLTIMQKITPLLSRNRY